MRTIPPNPNRCRNFACVMSFLLLPLLAGAQPYTLKANILEANNAPAEGEFLVLEYSTGNLIAAQPFQKGMLNLHYENADTLLLKIYAPGCNDTSMVMVPLKSEAIHDLGTIHLSPSRLLQEVIVSTYQPMFAKTAEGTRINVENTLLSTCASASELLSKTPGISIVGNKIFVFGVGEGMLMLNGKEIAFETFRSLPPGEISNIELITSPGAKYDARGKAVVIITLKKGYLEGAVATWTENVSSAFVPNARFGAYTLLTSSLNVNYRKNKFHLTAYYANDYGVNWNENRYATRISRSDGVYNTMSYYQEDSYSRNMHTYRLGAAYDLSDRSSISAQYDGLFNSFYLNVHQNGDYYTPQQELSLIRMQNDATTRLLNHSVNVNYLLKLDSLGKSNLFVGAQFNAFENNLFDNITETITPFGEEAYTSKRINDGHNLIQLATVQVDLTKQLERIVVESGFKLAQTTNSGEIKFYSKSETGSYYVENHALSNGNLYREVTPAIYTNLRGSFKKTTISAGVRVEYSNVSGYSKKTNTFLVDSNYVNLFPALKVSRELSEKITGSISYARKINRPLYQDMDPFMWYLDSLTSIQGNPKLVPELINQLEYRMSYLALAMRVGFTQSTNTIWAITKQGTAGPNSLVYTKDNIQHRYAYTIAVDIPIEREKYYSYTTIACNWYQFEDSRTEYSSTAGTPQVYLYTYHQFILPRLVNFEIYGEYYGKSSDGFTIKFPYYYLTAGVSRSFFKNTLSLQLTFNDLLRTARWRGVRTIGSYQNDYNQRINSHYLRFTLSYKFGGLRNFGYANKNINEKEFNRIKW